MNCGFDVAGALIFFTKNYTACTLELSTRDCARDALVLAALCPGTRVPRRLGGTVLPCTERAPGAWEVTVPRAENAVESLRPE